MPLDKAQKKKEFFEIREGFKKVEKYIAEVSLNNRCLHLDFWMDDLLHLARRYFEQKLAKKVNDYKKSSTNSRAMQTCYSLRCVFEKEGWDPGIFKKYGDFGEYVIFS